MIICTAKKFTRRDREQAALLCSLRACSWSPLWDLLTLGIEWASPAHQLADAAVNAAWTHLWYQDACAEAEAMLRTGWSP